MRLKELQQYLPLAVLKQMKFYNPEQVFILKLQQYLPLAVLKPKHMSLTMDFLKSVATVLTACGIETGK